MKGFLVENTRKGTTIKVMLHNPPYENENVLYKTGYKEKDCVITELKSDVSLYSLKSQIAPSLTVNTNSADFNTDIELLDPSIKKTGDLVTLNYSEVGWNNLEQAFATKKQGINPFGIANYNGLIGSTVHIINHSIIKAAIFLAIGCLVFSSKLIELK